MLAAGDPTAPEMPSVGSEGHALGTCKPCAFLHTKGCQNGVLCQFCHLCLPGEKKRRRKEKRHQEEAEVAVEVAETSAPLSPLRSSPAGLSPATALSPVFSPMPDTPQHYGDASDRVPLAPCHYQAQPQPVALWSNQVIPQPPAQPAPAIAPPSMQAWAFEARLRAEQIRSQQEMWAAQMQRNYLSSLQEAAKPSEQDGVPLSGEEDVGKDVAAKGDTPVKGGNAFDRLLSLVASGACQASTSPNSIRLTTEKALDSEPEAEETYSPEKVSPHKGRRGARRGAGGKENQPPQGQNPWGAKSSAKASKRG